MEEKKWRRKGEERSGHGLSLSAVISSLILPFRKQNQPQGAAATLVLLFPKETTKYFKDVIKLTHKCTLHLKEFLSITEGKEVNSIV